MFLEFSWNTPDCNNLPAAVPAMDRAGYFDGVITQAVAYTANGQVKQNLAWNALSGTAMPPGPFASSLAKLQAIKSKTLRSNYLLANASIKGLGPADWFDDVAWMNNCANAQLLSSLIYQAGLKGIFFDTEMYGPKVWTFKSQPQTHTQAEYQAQVKKRGVQWASALASCCQGLDILLTHGAATAAVLFYTQGMNGLDLLPSFLAGMLEGAPQAQFRDMMEYAFGVATVPQYQMLRNVVMAAAPVMTPPDHYCSRMAQGFMQFLDYQQKWSGTDFSLNYWQPAQWTATLVAAHQVAPVVVCYSQAANVWDGSLPAPYGQAFLDARKQVGI